MEKEKIVVFCPMDCEYSALASKIENAKVSYEHYYKITSGTIDGYPVVAVKILIGMVNAAAATMYCIDKFSPKCVIIQGTTGAHSPKLNKYDIILCEDIVDISTVFIPHRDKGDGIENADWDYVGTESIEPNGESKRYRVLHSDENLLKIAEKVPYPHGKLKRGSVGTADVWNREIDRINFFYEKFGTEGEEMETFAVAQICKMCNVPMLGIRVISNSELIAGCDFSEDTAIKCQEYTLDVIKAIIKNGK